jgi:hypothetical protein
VEVAESYASKKAFGCDLEVSLNQSNSNSAYAGLGYFSSQRPTIFASREDNITVLMCSWARHMNTFCRRAEKDGHSPDGESERHCPGQFALARGSAESFGYHIVENGYLVVDNP